MREKPVPAENDLIDAKVAAAEARTDAKLAGFQGQFEGLSLKLDSIAKGIDAQRAETKSSTLSIVGTVVSTGLVAVGLLYAMLSFGAASWYNGTVVRDQVTTAVQEALKQNTSKAP